MITAAIHLLLFLYVFELSEIPKDSVEWTIEEKKSEVIARGDFPETRWTMVASAQGAGCEDQKKEALSQLCEIYWYPLYAYLRRSGQTATDAEDLTQGFFCHLLSGERLQLLNAEKGKLRSYLLKALKNFASSERAKSQTLKRGGKNPHLSWDLAKAEERYDLEPRQEENPEQLFERGWAIILLDQAMNRLRKDYERNGRLKVFEVLKNSLGGNQEGENHSSLSEKLGISTGAIHVALHRLRQRYRRALELEIAETVVNTSEIEDEISHLHRIFER